MIVLHYEAAPVPPAGWWALLAAALAPGGVLFVCGPRSAGLPHHYPRCGAQICNPPIRT